MAWVYPLQKFKYFTLLNARQLSFFSLRAHFHDFSFSRQKNSLEFSLYNRLLTYPKQIFLRKKKRKKGHFFFLFLKFEFLLFNTLDHDLLPFMTFFFLPFLFSTRLACCILLLSRIFHPTQKFTTIWIEKTIIIIFLLFPSLSNEKKTTNKGNPRKIDF